MFSRHRFLLLVLVSVGWLLPVAAMAKDKPINSTWRGIAVDGTDVVAYFTQGQVVKGDAKITHEWAGATWRFASTEHRDLFQAAPEKYAPQFGGYCAWAVSQGYTAGIDPEAWKIVEGRLYLNYNKQVQARWEKDAAGNIRQAETNWPALHD